MGFIAVVNLLTGSSAAQEDPVEITGQRQPSSGGFVTISDSSTACGLWTAGTNPEDSWITGWQYDLRIPQNPEPGTAYPYILVLSVQPNLSTSGATTRTGTFVYSRCSLGERRVTITQPRAFPGVRSPNRTRFIPRTKSAVMGVRG